MKKEDSHLFAQIAFEFPDEAELILDEGTISDKKIDALLLERFDLKQPGTTRDKLYVLFKNLQGEPVGDLSTLDIPNIELLFEVQKKLGQGAFGVVLKAKEIYSGETVALKLIKPSSYANQKEANTLQWFVSEYGKNKFNPYIMSYFGSFNANYMKHPYFVIKTGYAPGRSLDTYVGNQFPPAVLKELSKQLLSGLSFLHDNGLAHRDMKLENVMYDEQEGITIIDLGSSCFIDDRGPTAACSTGRMVGTQLYFSPELVLQALRPTNVSTDIFLASDVWATGLILLSLLTRMVPWWFIMKDLPGQQGAYAFYDLFSSSPYTWLTKNMKSIEDNISMRQMHFFNLIKEMLLPQPTRISSAQALARVS